ncbi:MAG: conjugal transfer protein TraF [Neisseriaceae bacterium]|nr:conjugal transfer protein TraF [Neisseriaceae bacterium]
MKKTVSLIACLFALSACNAVSTQSTTTNTSQKSVAVAKVVEVHNKKELDTIVQEEKVVLIYFYAMWAGPSMILKPVIEDAAKELNVSVALVDVDKAEDKFYEQYNVDRVPVTGLVKNQQTVDVFIGVKSKDEVVNFIKPHL